MTATGDELLVAAGRTPNMDTLALDDTADSSQETSDSIDEMAATTQSYAADLASQVIDAISQAQELDSLIGD